MKLYHAPQSRSIRPRWLLEEIAVPYELVRIDLMSGDQKRPDYLRLNPNGVVPTLVDGELVVYESGAICEYLADRFPEKRLAPPVSSPARAHYYQWNYFAMCTLEPPAVAIFLHTAVRPETERIPAVVDESRAQLVAALRVVEQALAGRPFMLGPDFTASDVMIGSTLWWAQLLGMVSGDLPNVSAYIGRVAGRGAFQRASAD